MEMEGNKFYFIDTNQLEEETLNITKCYQQAITSSFSLQLGNPTFKKVIQIKKTTDDSEFPKPM